uniref:Retrovirus-related Pol polyprotein from transposon TNT 1-94-like beta-barrel domain-containing protein n=1 Tax=Lactuca sativa TaxID=4236 RepID=A0A9R1XRI4_LACSA|nr:hypothetical protein LSAT_V11C200087080 [Lactuca sativa]
MKNVSLKSDDLHFPNPDSKHKSNVSFVKVVKAKKVDVSQRKVEKEKIKVETLPLNDYISISNTNKFDLIDKIKIKVLCDELYDENWYIDSGCLHNMTSHKENLRDLRKLENAGVVKFGNNHKCKVKGYGKVMNGKFTVNRVAYVDGLHHNLISVSQLVVETGNQVIFDEEGSVITNK